MRIAVVYNAVSENPTPDEEDVLVQRDAVSRALEGQGHRVFGVACGLDLAGLKARLTELEPDAVFNLVESLDGDGRLIFLPAGVYESLGLPYTGAPLEALFLTSHKLMAKERMRACGLPTPDWVFGGFGEGEGAGPGASEGGGGAGGRFIIKSLWEDASIGLDDDSVQEARRPADLLQALARRAGEPGAPWFAERYIDGREINLALLGTLKGPQVLPPAEILFDAYPEGKPRIVGYKAKWNEDSFEYGHTPRSMDFPDTDRPMLEETSDMARRCWRLFGMEGYARVDFRIDADRRPWILEVNANPCLDPKAAGYAAAVAKAGMTYDEAIRCILECALRRRKRSSAAP